MSKTLLVDTNRAAQPIYQQLKQLGHQVWVVGNDLTQPLAAIAENYICLDYSDISQLSSLIEREQFDFLVPGCNDQSYKMCAIVNEGRFQGIDSPEVTEIVNTKSTFNRLTKHLSIPSPASLTVFEALNGRSVIVKPVDSFSGRGISVLAQPSELSLNRSIEFAKSVSHKKEVVIEEFIEGQLYSYSAFLEGGKVNVDFIVREDCSSNSFAVDTSCVDFTFSIKLRSSICRDVEALAHHLNLSSGLVHLQFIVREENYYVIEMTRRCPGDLYSLLIEYSTGYNYAAAYLSTFLGQSALLGTTSTLQKKEIIRHTVMRKKNKPFWGLEFYHSVFIKQLVPLSTPGDSSANEFHHRAAILFMYLESPTLKEEVYRRIKSAELYALT